MIYFVRSSGAFYFDVDQFKFLFIVTKYKQKQKVFYWVLYGVQIEMGIYLSTPKTEKFSDDGENDRLRYGLSSMQGWRATMEDAVSS